LLVGPHYASAATADAETGSHLVPARVIPAALDSQTVYPTTYATIAIDPLRAYQWQTIQVPEQWVNAGYYCEVWDAKNRIVPGFAAQRLTTSQLDISSIDPTTYPSIRIVLFHPPNIPPPDHTQPVFFWYHDQPNTRLGIFVGVIILMTASIFFTALRRRVGFRDILYAVHAALRVRHSVLVQPVTWALVIILCAGWFGVVLGTSVGGVQIVYLLIKLPFLFLCAFALTISAFTVFSLLSGVRASITTLVTQTLSVLATAAVALASLSTTILFFIVVDEPHDGLLILTLLCVGCAGLASLLRFFQWIRQQRSFVTAAILTVACFFLYSIVFLQLGWMLRPWVGVLDPIQHTVPFARFYTGNVFVEVFALLDRLL
jgi:hypothetical protein